MLAQFRYPTVGIAHRVLSVVGRAVPWWRGRQWRAPAKAMALPRAVEVSKQGVESCVGVAHEIARGGARPYGGFGLSSAILEGRNRGSGGEVFVRS